MSRLNGKFSGRKLLLSSALIAALLFPLVSAYAESFTVTSNKDLYTASERAIIVGIIPESAPEGYAILLRVTGPDESECAVQNILPDSDYSFVSRPVDLKDCGSGQYTVVAYYADLTTNSTFTVSNSSQTSQANRLELRLLKNVAIQAQETVNLRLREFLESNKVLPEDVADKYSLGVFEASLVLQAVDFGDTAEAKKHLIFAVTHFREVVDSMAEKRIIFEQAINLAASDDGGGAILERYDRIKEFYFRLEELAQKNGIDNQNEFGMIVSLLASSKQLIDDDNTEQAGKNLEQATEMLESIRQRLYEDHDSSGPNNSTSREADIQGKRLSNVADRFERTAYSILEDHPSQNVNATIQKVLGFISVARLDIEKGDYASARSNLSAAFSALDQAKEESRHDSEPADENASGEAADRDSSSSDGQKNAGSGSEKNNEGQ